MADLPENVARAWYARTLAAADSLHGLGRVSTWEGRRVSVGSVTAAARVISFLRGAAARVRDGRMSPRQYRRLRARLFSAVPTAAAAAGGGVGAKGGDTSGESPMVVAGMIAAGSLPTKATNASSAANTAASATASVEAPSGGA